MQYHTISRNAGQYYRIQAILSTYIIPVTRVKSFTQCDSVCTGQNRRGVSRISNMTSSCPQVTHVKHVKHPTSLCPISFSRTCLIQFSLYYCEFRLVLHSGKKKRTAFEHPFHSTAFKIHDVPPFSS